jgi:CTP:molybdopterin cytidylyltransferase MocA
MTSSSPSSQASQLHLAILFLAAGEGSRLGRHPKALLHQDGVTLLERFSRAIQEFSPVEYIVLTGFHAQMIESEIAKLNKTLEYPIRFIQNLSPEKGQPSSVRLGLESLQSEFDILLIALSDQPMIGVKEFQELLDEYKKRQDGEEIILPMVDGKRGNPVLFSHIAIADVLKTPGLDCRGYMDLNPNKIREMRTHNQAFVADVDTSEDIQKYKLRLPYS